MARRPATASTGAPATFTAAPVKRETPVVVADCMATPVLVAVTTEAEPDMEAEPEVEAESEAEAEAEAEAEPEPEVVGAWQ